MTHHDGSELVRECAPQGPWPSLCSCKQGPAHSGLTKDTNFSILEKPESSLVLRHSGGWDTCLLRIGDPGRRSQTATRVTSSPFPAASQAIRLYGCQEAESHHHSQRNRDADPTCITGSVVLFRWLIGAVGRRSKPRSPKRRKAHRSPKE